MPSTATTGQVTLRFLAAPTDAGQGGSVSGGRILEWIDKAGFACAAGWSGRYCVTAYVGNIDFHRPVQVGYLVEVSAQLVLTGRSSMTIVVDVSSGNPRGGQVEHAFECRMVFVAVDDEGRTVDVAQWDPPGAVLRAAQAEARRRIVVQAGEYYIDEPIVLTDRDNGLTIEATASTDVTLYGGSMVTGWQKDGPDFCAATLPGVKEGQWDFRTLIVNGRYCPRARLPKEGRFEHRSVFDVPWMSTTGGGWKRKPTEIELTTMKYRPEDLGPWLDIRNAEITVYHMWDDSMVGVAAIDAAITRAILSFWVSTLQAQLRQEREWQH